MTDKDTRFTHGLISDVFAALESHGYTRTGDEHARNQATGRSIESLYRLVRDFEGVLDRDEDRTTA